MNKMFEIFTNEFGICFNEIKKKNYSFFVSTRTNNYGVRDTSLNLRCPLSATLRIHSHPTGNCKFSDIDLKAFQNSKRKYEGLICGKNSLIIINRNNELVDYSFVLKELK